MKKILIIAILAIVTITVYSDNDERQDFLINASVMAEAVIPADSLNDARPLIVADSVSYWVVIDGQAMRCKQIIATLYNAKNQKVQLKMVEGSYPNGKILSEGNSAVELSPIKQ